MALAHYIFVPAELFREFCERKSVDFNEVVPIIRPVSPLSNELVRAFLEFLWEQRAIIPCKYEAHGFVFSSFCERYSLEEIQLKLFKKKGAGGGDSSLASALPLTYEPSVAVRPESRN